MQLGYIWKTDFKEYLIKSQLRSCHPQSAVRRLGSKLCLSGAVLRKLHRPPVCLQGPGGPSDLEVYMLLPGKELWIFNDNSISAPLEVTHT